MGFTFKVCCCLKVCYISYYFLYFCSWIRSRAFRIIKFFREFWKWLFVFFYMYSVVILVILSSILVLVLTVVKFLISDSSFFSFSREEVSSYECGFEQYSLSRLPISIRYFLLTLVFLIFDIEVMLLFISPVDSIFSVSSSYFAFVSFFFIFILILGLLYEWKDGALEWVI